MRLSWKVGITPFLWMASSLLVIVVAAVCFNAIYNMREIKEKAAAVKDESLAETIESQRCLISIESLRRLAEVAYISDNPERRRSARITAQSLADEAAFFRNKEFYLQAQEVSAHINLLVKHKDVASANCLRAQGLSNEFSFSLHRMASYVPNIEAMQEVVQAYLSTSLPHADAAHTEGLTASELGELQKSDFKQVRIIRNYCEQYAVFYSTLGELCERQGELYRSYALEQEQMVANTALARRQWEELDVALREMRDGISREGEFATLETLGAIEKTAADSQRDFIFMLAGGACFFAVYLFTLHWFLVRPIRWTGKKFQDIHSGVPHGPMPVIHIQELYNVGALLDRFSNYLTDLITHAAQLEEEAADKRDMEELMAAVFRVSLDGYCVWTPTRLYTANSGFLTIFGAASCEDIWLNWERIGFTEKEQLQDIFNMVAATGFFRREMAPHRLDGEEIPCEVTYLPVTRHGESCVLSYFRDLREQKRTEEELRLARDSAEAAAKIKSEFLARMSHEIRTPMNGVLGLTHLALAQSPPPAQREFLEKIQASARILLGVINDILDFSKIDSGNLVLEQADFSFKNMLETVTDLFVPLASQKGLSFNLELDGAVPEVLSGDELRLSQVLLNLCSNAVKFTEKGSVTLHITLVEQQDEQVTLEFAVTDTGVGMSEEELSGLFRPFAQSDTSTTRKYGGTGLGLVISKLLVEKMGGRIAVASTPGAGSTFSFTTMLNTAGDAPEEDTPKGVCGSTSTSLNGLRILLAEDNEVNREIAVALLEDLGITVVVACNGREAVELLAEIDVDGILMDIQMPEMDGHTAAMRIRAEGREGVRHLPIIAMTAHAMQEDRDKSMAAGMNGHLTKPIDVGQLRQALCSLVAGNSGTCGMPERTCGEK